MRKTFVKVTVTVALFLGFISAQAVDRDLQALPPPPAPVTPARVLTSTPLRYYGEDYTIPFVSTLGCGACINGGYTYCIQGKEGDDYTGKTLTQKCCAAGSTATACPEISNPAYTCSNNYSDRTLAKSICPFRQTACGPK
jgi:hypothetical protein